jgi:hypothetical protein
MSDLLGEDRAQTKDATHPKNVHPRSKFTASTPLECFLFQAIIVGMKYTIIAAIMRIDVPIFFLWLNMD